jgi:hypothetical protein
MELGTVFVEAVVLAAGRPLAVQVGGLDKLDYDLLTNLVKAECKANIDKLWSEWTELAHAHVSEATTRAFVNAQAHELGANVIDAYHTEMAFRD